MLKVQEIRELIKLIDQSAIDEFTYETNGTTVSMKKSNGHTVAAANAKSAETIEQPAEPVKTAEPEAVRTEPKEENLKPEKSAEENTADFDQEIVSPMVGTFYTKPNPESDVYVKQGSKVEAETVVCIVEAMKLFNEIEAETTGEITEVLVEDGELVEYGQPLFRVKTK
ncbi:acetyl-CoA carboxylase biotin carboxyl carrier protein [Lentibacillus sp. CBA3610]|uniref:acetyl-CoA carboxylase biotin carboxyl carrier protein n=1 Tax=Lentibacillus sp. CBA3610 TaxID=2518176 RepID=UPI0015950761|nr:acetyl-CoA carboxylase biotin carboxyl carrier protein [Lentibacillus sp. CBA3610]QKY69299.1 acetyl-CoA carboxylase biotin carboxyl carrier protein [Lentibacillus sp. CBA3610]